MQNLQDTFVFGILTKTIDVATITRNISDESIVTNNELRDILNTIHRKFNFASKAKVLENVVNEKIKFVFEDKTGFNLPSYFPFWGKLSESDTKIFVNLSRYTKRSSDGTYNIQPRTLYSLIMSASVSLAINTSPTKVTMNTTLIRLASRIYSAMLFKVIDKVHGISQDSIKTDFILFLISKYFISTIVGITDEEKVNNLAYASIKNNSTLNGLKLMEDGLVDLNYADFNTFISSLSQVAGLKSIQTRPIMENFIRSFGESTLLSLENFNYFNYAIISAVIGGYVNNETYIQSVAGKDLEPYFLELAKTL